MFTYFSLISSTCPAYLILLHLIILGIYSEKYTLWISSLCFCSASCYCQNNLITLSCSYTWEQVFAPTKVQAWLYFKNAVFWAVTTCRSCVNRRFGGMYHLHFQGRKFRERITSASRWLQTEPPVKNTQLCVQSAAFCSRWFLACGILYPEDGGGTFLRNLGSQKIYTTPHPRRRHIHSHRCENLKSYKIILPCILYFTISC
jgi:hypothetical protein